MDTSSHAIAALFDRQHRDLGLLMDALTAEHKALTGNAVDAIEAATAAKHDRLLEIEAGFRDQARWLADAGLAPDDHGMTTYLQGCDPRNRAALEQRWREIKALLARCREQNLVNGRILTLNQRQTQRALAILRGGSAAPDDCYGPGGRTAGGLAPRSLGKV